MNYAIAFAGAALAMVSVCAVAQQQDGATTNALLGKYVYELAVAQAQMKSMLQQEDATAHYWAEYIGKPTPPAGRAGPLGLPPNADANGWRSQK
jgi:surface antigen